VNAPITSISTDSGNDLPVPTSDDTGNVGELLTENTQAAEQDVTFGQKVLKAYVWSSKQVRVSYQLLQDSAIDMNAFLGRKLGERIGRAQAPYWISGTGVSQPEGILTGISTTTAGAAAALDYDDFVNIEHAVDPAYRNSPSTGYVLSDDALKKTRLVKDLQDRPLWMPMAMAGFEGGFPATINGFPYWVDVNLPAATTGLTPLVFGDLSYYWARDVVGVQLLRLTERYADFLQVGFLAFARADGRKVDAGNDPFRALIMA
jgi:HK97 family phage major capsid protein